MEVWIVISIFVLCIGQIKTYPTKVERLTRQVRQCQGPDVQTANGTLVPSNDFPRNDFKKALNNHPNSTDIVKMIKTETKELKEISKMENSFEHYSAYCYTSICKSKSTVIKQWRVEGTNCWSIQPVIWRKCKMNPLDDCADDLDTEGMGFACHPDYKTQTVLVYCKQTVSPIRYMTVIVSFKCSLTWYYCLDGN